MEEITEDRPRIKFKADWVGPIDPQSITVGFKEELDRLASLQNKLESIGVIPILNDGLLGGNCALRPSHEKCNQTIFVSKSGKQPHKAMTGEDFVKIVSFDRNDWSVKYESVSDSNRPSSDTPLHMAALQASNVHYGWSQEPRVVVHGHALAEGRGLQVAVNAGLPVSTSITLFSTPEDLRALEDLLIKHPYPHYRCYIRRGHGFFLLAKDIDDAWQYIDKTLIPLIQSGTVKEENDFYRG